MWLVHNEQIWKIFFPSLQTLPTQQELLVLGYCHSSHRKDFKHIPMHIFIYLPPLFLHIPLDTQFCTWFFSLNNSSLSEHRELPPFLFMSV